jgi:predicted RNase H-like HicB family nuclease
MHYMSYAPKTQNTIHALWDDEARVWVATSDDVPGLVAEADTVEALNVKLESLIPELMQLNGQSIESVFSFELLARRTSQALLH